MITHNNTTFTEADIEAMPVLGSTVSKWRQRNITLRQHPHWADHVVSVGITFNGGLCVISAESKLDWRVALEYASRGEVYVSE